MTITTELAQRMRSAAKKWQVADEKYDRSEITIAELIVVAEEYNSIVRNPSSVLALLDALADKDKQIAELESDATKLITERDNVEEALADMYEAATGERPEWSSAFGFDDAVEVVGYRVEAWIDQVRTIDMSNSVLQAQLEARPEQQPVAFTEECEITNMQATGLYLRGFPTNAQGRDIPLYTAAPAAQPVTVKRPETSCIGWVEEAIHEHDEKWIETLRAAGITIAAGE